MPRAQLQLLSDTDHLAEPVSSRQAPSDGSPRDRLLERGAEALHDRELVQVILGTARAEHHSRQLLDGQPLSALLQLDPSCAKPLSPGALARLLAALEMAKRLQAERMPVRDLLDRPEATANYLRLRHSDPDQEIMGALYLNVRNRLIRDQVVFRGTLTRAAADPRPILKQALALSASGLIVYHSHPSGDPSPSSEDLDFTRRLAEAGKLLGVKLLDHLILGSAGRWVSLGRRGAW